MGQVSFYVHQSNSLTMRLPPVSILAIAASGVPFFGSMESDKNVGCEKLPYWWKLRKAIPVALSVW